MQPLTGFPRGSFTDAEVLAALAFTRAPKVRHGVDVLDTSDIETGETVPIEDGEVVWSYRPPDPVVDGGSSQTTDVTAVRRQASLTVVGTPDVPLALRRYRPWTEWLAPTGVWVRFNLGVFAPTNPPIEDDGMVIRHRLNLADKTYRYAGNLLDETLVVVGGTNPVAWVIADLAATFGETAFSITSTTVTLVDDMVFEPNTSRLAVYNALLNAAAFDQLTADENGRPSSIPLTAVAAKGSEWSYGSGAGKIVTAGNVEPLLPTLPNVVRFVARQGPSLPEEGNGVVTVINQLTGPASIVQRGEQVLLRVEVDAEDETALEQIAAAEAQRFFAGGGLRFTGQVALNPLHGDRDLITLSKPRLGLDGLWQVTEWRYPLKPIVDSSAVLMAITCERRVG